MNMIGEFVRVVASQLCKNSVAANLYFDYKLQRQIDRFEASLLGGNWSRNLLGVSEVIDSLSGLKRGNVCHILASGWSALDGIGSVKIGEDFVFGFNFAAIHKIPFDAYFIEVAAQVEGRIGDLSKLQAELINNYADVNADNIFIKNLYSGNVDDKYVAENYSKHVKYVKDIQFPFDISRLGGAAIDNAIKSIFKSKNGYIVQYGATFITCIILAFLLGFKKIVLHGVDLYGDCFFSSGIHEVDDDFLSHLRIYYPQCKKSTQHITCAPVAGVLLNIRRFLHEHSVELFAGVDHSPISKILPVYL